MLLYPPIAPPNGQQTPVVLPPRRRRFVALYLITVAVLLGVMIFMCFQIAVLQRDIHAIHIPQEHHDPPPFIEMQIFPPRGMLPDNPDDKKPPPSEVIPPPPPREGT